MTAVPPAVMQWLCDERDGYLAIAKLIESRNSHIRGYRCMGHRREAARFQTVISALRGNTDPMSDLRPMSCFDPSKKAMLYDELNGIFFEWQPEWEPSWKRYAGVHDKERSVMEWDGLPITGWMPV